MANTHLNQKEINYIFKLCNKALEHVCETVEGVSDNIVAPSLPVINHLYKQRSYGLLGYIAADTRQNESQNNASVKPKNYRNRFRLFTSKLKSNANHSRLQINNARLSIYVKEFLFNENQLMISEYAKSAKTLKTGRCLELCCLAYMFLSEQILKKDVSVKLFHGQNFDHVFLALGLPDDVDMEDFRTWPEDTVILDPWLRCKFLLKDMPLYWRDMAYVHNWDWVRHWAHIGEIMHSKNNIGTTHSFFENFKPKYIVGFVGFAANDLIKENIENIKLKAINDEIPVENSSSSPKI